MLYIIVIAVVIVLVAIVAVVMSARRSRSARSDWLGELSEIRRSSLGDDEEVTGALEVISVDDPQGAGATGNDDPAPEAADDRPVEKDDPDATLLDAGATFWEWNRDVAGFLRVEATDPRGLRVLSGVDGTGAGYAVSLPRGVLWHRSASPDSGASCSIRTPAGWIVTTGLVAILIDETEATYVLCLAGEATVRTDAGRARVKRGQIGRVVDAASAVQIADVGVDALESDSIVRRQRRLDSARSASPGTGGDHV